VLSGPANRQRVDFAVLATASASTATFIRVSAVYVSRLTGASAGYRCGRLCRMRGTGLRTGNQE
jgi:hypothetical protein